MLRLTRRCRWIKWWRGERGKTWGRWESTNKNATL